MKKIVYTINFLFFSVFIFCNFYCNDENAKSSYDYDATYTGGEYHLGPVEWDGSIWNSCAPYHDDIKVIEGNYLAGLELYHNGDGKLCDACVKITTDMGKELILRVVTTGVTTKNSIDVSPEAYAILNSGEYPRSMSWKIVKCPSNGHPIYYQFHSSSHQWWTAFWARNIGYPLKKVEVKTSKHNKWHALKRETDGKYVDSSGFSDSEPFSIKLTSIDGQEIIDTFSSYSPGSLLASSGQFE